MRRSVASACVMALCAVITLLFGWRGEGPLASLFDHGDESRHPVALIDPSHTRASRSGFVAFQWDDQNWCPELFVVTAEETDSQVVVSDVRIRATPARVACLRGGTPTGTALAKLILKSPLGNREVVRATDGQVLPIRDRP